jgi:riboflavin kinase
VISLRGVVTSGLGRATQFMGLDWVRTEIGRLAGFDPYPGTLNLRLLEPTSVDAWRRIRQGPALVLVPPPPAPCGARLFRAVVVPDLAAAVIVPDPTSHADDVLEVVAAVHVRRLLGLRDDDAVTLLVAAEQAEEPAPAPP